ncbi:MAG: hypothetical protein IPL08_17640 [Saprospiraceae bacterium]|nr:hypothetical protein [Saprospiraceae bacterium]MBK8349340.1 hypothetical protein [Saprospiraceae bacterium]MBK8670727.1 hypothetical protein [Saprospiraceae bacterium]
MYKARQLSPMIPSFDIAKTASFFIDLLSFEILRDDKTYVILQKDNLTIHILRAGKDIGEMEFYLEVDDIQSIWNYIKGNLDGIKFKEPFDQIYGMREIHLVIPMTKTLLFIGQQIG